MTLATKSPRVFTALSELDALDHRLLKRAADDALITGADALVGLSILRRAVTLFIGLRHLLEAAAVEPAKLVARAQFETLLAFRYLVHGGRRRVTLHTPSSPRARETRARYFYVAAERRKVYQTQGALDGRWGRRVRRSTVKHMNAEIATKIALLATHYPAQTAAFGPYLCYTPTGKNRRYHDFLHWYAFGFPKKNRQKVNTVRALAGRFGLFRDYELLYDSFSGMMHPRGISHDAEIVDGRLDIFSPYLVEAFPILSTFCCRWQVLILAFAVRAYHPQSLEDAQTVGRKVNELLPNARADIPAGFF